jgi:hypothetical protein
VIKHTRDSAALLIYSMIEAVESVKALFVSFDIRKTDFVIYNNYKNRIINNKSNKSKI